MKRKEENRSVIERSCTFFKLNKINFLPSTRVLDRKPDRVTGYKVLINLTSLYKLYIFNKGNAKCGVSPRLKIRPCDLDLWPWKSIGFQTLLRTKYVPSLVKIHWRILILECSQGCYAVKIWPGDLDLWPWKSIGFQTLVRSKYVPSLVKIHWRMLILECSQGCYTVKIWPGDLDLWSYDLENQ